MSGSAFAVAGLGWLLFVGVFDVRSGGRLDLRGVRSGELRAGRLMTASGGERWLEGGVPFGVLDLARVFGELLAELLFGEQGGEPLGVLALVLEEAGGSAVGELGGVAVAVLGGLVGVGVVRFGGACPGLDVSALLARAAALL